MLPETEVVAAEAESALPRLSGSSNPDLLRQVLNILKGTPGGQAARADPFERLVPQIDELGGGFEASRSLGSEGSIIFLGKTGQALVISPEGQIFRGQLESGFRYAGNGILTPIFENLTRVD